jgi:dTDP-4-dehydrorhamnose 3,5-epimerase-like enzyme
MKVEKIPIKRNQDDRGVLDMIYDQNQMPLAVRRVYAVWNFSKDTIRGFHKNFDECKYFYVVRGSVKFVVMKQLEGDTVMPESQIQEIILSDKVPEILVIPPETWTGWKALEEGTILIGLSDKQLSDHVDERMIIWPYADRFKIKDR